MTPRLPKLPPGDLFVCRNKKCRKTWIIEEPKEKKPPCPSCGQKLTAVK